MTDSDRSGRRRSGHGGRPEAGEHHQDTAADAGDLPALAAEGPALGGDAGGTYRVNRRLTHTLGDGRIEFAATGYRASR